MGLVARIVHARDHLGDAVLLARELANDQVVLVVPRQRSDDIGRAGDPGPLEHVDLGRVAEQDVVLELLLEPLEAIDVRNSATGEMSRLTSGGLFIFIGADAETGWLPPEIALDRHGYVLTGSDVRAAGRWALERDPYLLETSVPGIFACGDVRSSEVKRVAAAVGEGSMAVKFVHQQLKDSEPQLDQ